MYKGTGRIAVRRMPACFAGSAARNRMAEIPAEKKDRPDMGLYASEPEDNKTAAVKPVKAEIQEAGPACLITSYS